MKKFIDTHCHIFKEYYDDIPFLMCELTKNDVKAVINNAVDINTINEVLSLSNNYDNMYCAIGIHPEYASDYKEEDLKFLKDNLTKHKVVAIGEIGLDYHYEGYDKNKQIRLFKEQLDIAHEYNLPVIIHSRDATMDTINILKEYNLNGVIHSFSGSYETACEYIKLGYYLGINGVVTFKNAKLIEVLRKIGLDRIVLETDSPYLTPVPFRGKKNSPDMIAEVIKFLALNLNKTADEVVEITNKNVHHIFDIR